MKVRLLIVGLGNPGSAYRGTYHNAGRDVAEQLARKMNASLLAKKAFQAQIAEITGGFILLPETYMNLSGRAVRPFAGKNGIELNSIVVLVDDVYIDAGTIRIRTGGSCGGHNGLKSIEESFGSDAFPRVRIGVGPDPGGAYRSDYVLSRPRPDAEAAFFEAKARALAAVETILDRGLEHAMNVLN